MDGSLPHREVVKRVCCKGFSALLWVQKESHYWCRDCTSSFSSFVAVRLLPFACRIGSYDVLIGSNDDVLESLKERPCLETLEALQKFLCLMTFGRMTRSRIKVSWRKCLPSRYGNFGSRILVTTRMDSIAMMIANALKRRGKYLGF
ncbi:hypothetical protein KFK09_009525 [Dendrobium nobile]|uniref:Uncharacterized protein n=1 Tax=Dendrobium nobile TaxID=94219 RepID=A0A8T3BJN5_DENNO|nr:hypothetical protein KFK09_009525 [Dendrobium nobile]